MTEKGIDFDVNVTSQDGEKNLVFAFWLEIKRMR